MIYRLKVLRCRILSTFKWSPYVTVSKLLYKNNDDDDDDDDDDTKKEKRNIFEGFRCDQYAQFLVN